MAVVDSEPVPRRPISRRRRLRRPQVPRPEQTHFRPAQKRLLHCPRQSHRRPPTTKSRIFATCSKFNLNCCYGGDMAVAGGKSWSGLTDPVFALRIEPKMDGSVAGQQPHSLFTVIRDRKTSILYLEELY